MSWYHLTNPDAVDSPALLINPDGVRQNIRQTLSLVEQALPADEPGGPTQLPGGFVLT